MSWAKMCKCFPCCRPKVVKATGPEWPLHVISTSALHSDAPVNVSVARNSAPVAWPTTSAHHKYTSTVIDMKDALQMGSLEEFMAKL